MESSLVMSCHVKGLLMVGIAYLSCVSSSSLAVEGRLMREDYNSLHRRS